MDFLILQSQAGGYIYKTEPLFECSWHSLNRMMNQAENEPDNSDKKYESLLLAIYTQRKNKIAGNRLEVVRISFNQL